MHSSLIWAKWNGIIKGRFCTNGLNLTCQVQWGCYICNTEKGSEAAGSWNSASGSEMKFAFREPCLATRSCAWARSDLHRVQELWGKLKPVSPCALGDCTHQEGSRGRNSGPRFPLQSALSRASLTLHQGWILLSDVPLRSNGRCPSLGHAQPLGMGGCCPEAQHGSSCLAVWCSSWVDLEMSLPWGQDSHTDTACGGEGLSLVLRVSKPCLPQLSKGMLWGGWDATPGSQWAGTMSSTIQVAPTAPLYLSPKKFLWSPGGINPFLLRALPSSPLWWRPKAHGVPNAWRRRWHGAASPPPVSTSLFPSPGLALQQRLSWLTLPHSPAAALPQGRPWHTGRPGAVAGAGPVPAESLVPQAQRAGEDLPS